MCTHNRVCLFGEVRDQVMWLSPSGEMIAKIWTELSRYYPVELDTFVIMPNHMHGIIGLQIEIPPLYSRISPDVGPAQGPAPTDRCVLSLSDLVERFKSLTTTRYIRGVRQFGWPSFNGHLWQRSFHEHVIRSTGDFKRIQRYIFMNPANWPHDPNRPCD